MSIGPAGAASRSEGHVVAGREIPPQLGSADGAPLGGPRRDAAANVRSRGRLLVRLRNWVGDVLLGVPMLQRLADAGFELELVGKGWARDLLAGHGWPVHALPKTFGERVRLLRALRLAAVASAGTGHSSSLSGHAGGIDAMCLPYSFSSALEFRLAGLRAVGHAHEGRSLLLARSVPLLRGRHELAVYWQLGDELLGEAAPLPKALGLQIAQAHHEAAAALCRQHSIEPGFIVVCPFAGGTFEKLPKTWPDFATFVQRDLATLVGPQKRRIVVCPGPGEEALAEREFGTALCLAGVSLGTYAALLTRCALMISNDTGPGHLAAAVGAPLLSVLGPTDPARWGAWGPRVHTLGGQGPWPERAEVAAAVRHLLEATPSGLSPAR